MSPLIEDARRRQRRRRLALAGLLLVAAGLATLVAVLHRGPATSSRQAQPGPATVVLAPAGGAPVLRTAPSNTASGEPATVLRTLVLRVARRNQGVGYRAVRIDPKTGAVTLVTTTTR